MAQAKTFQLGGSSRTGLLLALFLAVITGLLVFAALNANDNGDGGTKSATGGPETTVVTAKQNIAARTEIKADMVELTKVPANALLGGAFSSTDLVVGRVARIPVYKGEQLVQDKLAADKTDLGLSYIVPEGSRAMAVKVDKVIGAGGLIRPGDRVDVIAVVDVKYTDLTTDREFTETRSFTLAQNVSVLAVEQKLENQVPPQTTSSSSTADADTAQENALVDQPDAQPDGTVVTLALLPEMTQKVLISEEKGKIRLTVRAPGDNEIVETDDTTFLSLADANFQKLIIDALKTAK
ncbi:MAG: Flp pilus assembly protein CpaB [Dehalococcoidia bacterium]